eukprot:TRINITY_DN36639_c0_g1_i1.p1 TRINITY_DN36639_c0_g1~~TRINITY_DN36639_c0_g1_i1.p1  ORF type:complete len:191 (+),score=9.59 TRINITY_DN36639_c0_g1_i1:2-574(+)
MRYNIVRALGEESEDFVSQFSIYFAITKYNRLSVHPQAPPVLTLLQFNSSSQHQIQFYRGSLSPLQKWHLFKLFLPLYRSKSQESLLICFQGTQLILFFWEQGGLAASKQGVVDDLVVSLKQTITLLFHTPVIHMNFKLQKRAAINMINILFVVLNMVIQNVFQKCFLKHEMPQRVSQHFSTYKKKDSQF